MGISESQRLEILYRIAHELHNQDLKIQAVLQTVLSMTGKAIDARHGCMILINGQGAIENAYILGETERGADERRLWNLLINRGLIGFVHHGRRTIIVRSLRTDPRWPDMPDNPVFPQEGAAIGLPLEKKGRIFGVMVLIHEQIDYFDREMAALLEAIANIASSAIGNAAEFDQAYAVKTRYQWLFNDSIVPIILTDLDGSIIDANRQACAFLKYELQKLKTLDIAAIHRMGTGPLGANRLESLQMGKQIEFRTTAWSADGKDIPVMVRARRLSLENQDLIEWVEQDITAQMALEQLRADLSAMVYHDLRGPVQNVQSSFVMLARLLPEAEKKAQDFIQIGLRSTRQLSRMIESLLDIQRMEEGQAVLDCKITSLHSLLANAIELVQPLAAEANQRLTFDLSPDLPFVKIDGDMILRVVINLIENAVKYTPEGGSIKVSARVVDNDTICIGVTDSGPGIPRHMQTQIFDKFSRVKYTDAPKGLGLGLAFCRLAVEAHNGTIWVESEPGKGSVFQFALPLDAHPEQTPVS